MEDNNFSDKEIVAKSLIDRESFGILVERYEAKLRRYIRRLGVLNIDDQTDILQEIFIKTYQNLNSFDANLSFSAWIYRIAHNQTVSWHRKLMVRPENYAVSEGDKWLQFLHTADDSAEETFDKKISAEQLNQGLKQLSEKYRNVIVLRYFEELEYEEISDILKVPVSSVGTLLSRGKSKLKDVLKALPLA